ncbi:MAG: hypothetical protein NZ518_08425, partial [Dehalococcoidia bacterium]|nr:hypothetical protein [Dehalococcoidia bacterium]
PTAAAPITVGSGAIVLRNLGPVALICAYNGESASTQVQVASNGVQTISLPAGRYLERCVAPGTFGGGELVEVIVTAGETVQRVVR